MNLKDLKIGTQLRLGMGLIVAVVIAMGVLAWVQANRLWLQTKGLYEHPLQVRQAIGDIETDVESIARQMRDLFMAKSEQERMIALQGIEGRKANAGRQMALLYDRYLGPREDLDALSSEFEKWDALRDVTVRLIAEEKNDEAEARIRLGGVQAAQMEVVRNRLLKVDDFALNKSNAFYRTAAEKRTVISRQLGAATASVLLLTLFITWRLYKGIKRPLVELTAAAEQFRQGKLDVRSPQSSANEFGTLAAAFNSMADSIQAELRSNGNAARLAGIMLREAAAPAFCREVLKALLQETDSQVGAIYFLNDAKDAFEPVEAIGLGAGGRTAFSATGLEGELGKAVATRLIQRITDIPDDTRFTFAAVSGTFRPREILTIPVLSGHAVVAVISLACVHAYSETALRLVHDIWSMMNARVNGVLAFRQIQKLVAQLEQQNGELEAQKQELAVQTDELTGQNAELEMQKFQLDEASRLKTAFLSNMSHELRTPLNSVIALSGVLSRRLSKTLPAEEAGYLEIIERNGKNLLALINDILDLSRIEAGHTGLDVCRFSLRELTNEIVAMLGHQAQVKGLTLTSLVGDDLPTLTSDSDKLRHVLQNLVGNAVKFTEDGSVEISALQSGDDLRITVRDTGIGIAADQLPYIFDAFRQADGSTSRKYGGTGLGLAIAKEHARLLGGDITVESVPGKGSTFTLRLPRELPESVSATASAGSFAAPVAGPTPVPPGRGQTILVVEDNEPAIIQLTDILNAEGYRVQVARNGKEALAQVGQAAPDAMILDLMMPEVDGFQVLQAIRDVEQTAQLPVLILTAKHVTKEELGFLKSNHVHQLIQKGDVNRDGLLAAVARMVAPPSKPESSIVPPRRCRRPSRPGKPVILLVEDSPDNMCTALALLGDRYRVVQAVDGRSAVEQARLHLPDLVLTDIALPVMDGVEALAVFRQDEALRDIPVIAVTASAMKGSREEILAHGFDGYISKPIDHGVLMKTLQEFLDCENGG